MNADTARRAGLLDKLARIVRQCTDCPLHEGRMNAVPGEGPADAELMLVGEGPGRVEDETGRPFVGPAGQLLEELLASIDLTRDRVFIGNVVKCRPPGNRAPLPDERKACSKYLGKQIEIIRPKVLAPLGASALSMFAHDLASIGRMHGQVMVKKHYLLVPMYHPAAALHNPSLRDTLFRDMSAIMAALRQAGGQGGAAGSPSEPGG